ncbi:MAG: VPS10 domain-containing protein [Flavobacteriales bacterium]
MKSKLLFVLCLFVFSSQELYSQKKKNTKPESTSQTSSKVDLAKYNGMKWRCIGPFQGGRSLAVSGVIGDELTYYMGATGGGVWKTTNGGNYWFPISDSNFTSASVGALAVAPSDPNVIYVGMGEAAIRNTAIMGDGIYKSVDAGTTWKRVLKLDASATGRIVIHPTDPDIAYAAIMGKMFGSNAERGIYKTSNGGETWEKILYKNELTGAIDIDFNPSNPNVVYATFWQVNRKPWKLDSGGPGCDLLKSTDGGKTWKSLVTNPGMPKGVLGKMGVSVSASNPERVYALIESKTPGMYRSDNGGATWTLVSTSNDITQRPWYFSGVFCDPKNEDVVYVTNLELMKSTDGGKTYSKIEQEHGDNHDLWINPSNSENFVLGCDGSVTVTMNGGDTWTAHEIPTSQFYHVNIDDDFPYNAYGGQQDWGSVRIATRSYQSGIGDRDWYNVAGGEAGYIVPQPGNPDVTYGGEYDGIMTRFDHSNHQDKFVSVYPLINDGWGGETWKYRFAWTYPILFSPWNKDVLYCTSNYVHRSTDNGMSWETISPDLTRDDPSKQLQSGGVLTPDNTGAEIYCTIYAFAESTIKQGLLWAASDDGLVHISEDNGITWNKVTPAGLPEWSTINIIEPSSHDAGTCYIAAHRYRLDDTKPYLYKTTDYGKTWKQIVNGIKEGDYTRCIREDPNTKGLLYAGTERGIYVSFDDGEQWQSLQLNLPVTPVWDLRIHKELAQMVIATHGRSFWVMDDLTPLYEIKSNSTSSDFYLFKPQQAIRMGGDQRSPEAAMESKIKEGTNAPNGVICHYYLKQPATGEIRLAFYTEKGDSIIAFSSLTDPTGKPFVKEEEQKLHPTLKIKKNQLNTRSGMHQFVWDMRYPSAKLIEEDYWAPEQLHGPSALPGSYTIKLWINGKMIQTNTFKIVLDPQVRSSASDLQAQFDLSMNVNRKQDEIVKKILQIRGVRKQVNDFMGSFTDTTDIKTLKKWSKPLLDSLQAIEDTLFNSKIKTYLDPLRYPYQILERYGSLSDFLNADDGRPSKQMQDVYDEINGRYAIVSKRLDAVFEIQVADFNRAIDEKKWKVLDPVRIIKK